MGKYCDKEIDAWHQEARAASDPAARKAIYEKIAARFLPEGWIFYLYHPQYLIAHIDRLEGFKPLEDLDRPAGKFAAVIATPLPVVPKNGLPGMPALSPRMM